MNLNKEEIFTTSLTIDSEDDDSSVSSYAISTSNTSSFADNENDVLGEFNDDGNTTPKLDSLFQSYRVIETDEEDSKEMKQRDNNININEVSATKINLRKIANGKGDEINSVAVATKIGEIIQNLGIAESNSDIPPWAKSLIMALGEATTELQYISTDQSEKTKELNTTISDQSVKINQLEERCHIQEFLMKILQEEKDLLTERISNFEVQMKRHKKEKKSFLDQIESIRQEHEMEKKTFEERIEQLEEIFEEQTREKVFLLNKIDSFETTLQTNKDEKEQLLTKVDQLETSLNDAIIYIKRHCLLNNRDSQGDLSTKGIDRNSDNEAVRNFIHNMLHKDKLSKLI